MWSEHADGMLRFPEVNACLVRWTSQVQLIEASHVKTTCGSELTKKFRYFVFSDFQVQFCAVSRLIFFGSFADCGFVYFRVLR